MTSKNRSHHDVLEPSPATNPKEINLTQGEDVSPHSDREEEIRPSHIRPNEFKVNALGVSATKGPNSVNASL